MASHHYKEIEKEAEQALIYFARRTTRQNKMSEFLSALASL